MKNKGNGHVLVSYDRHGYLANSVICFLIFVMATNITNSQELRLSGLFSDHMVLQREIPVPIWGKATPGEPISVKFADQVKKTKTGEDGKWMVKLDPLKASKIGRDLMVSGKSETVISDILVGEVWICSGQSNMQFRVDAVPEIKALAPFANHIRSFEVPRTVSLKEEENVAGEWGDIPPNSAVAFSFAFFLKAASEMPVGIIHASWGSSSIEAWMPRDMAETFPYFRTIMEEFDSNTSTQRRISDILAKENGWTNKDDIFLRRQPNILYNAMMKPLAPFAVRGLVWYQGERNTRYMSGVPEVSETNWFHRVAGMKEYGDILSEWILRYRNEWQNEDMNFMVVMLPGYGKGTVSDPDIDPKSPTAQSWAWMRESQMKVRKLPNTSVANTIDLGDEKNIHPTDKLPIGLRLALLAAKNTLDQEVIAEGPLMQKVEIKGNDLVVHFANAKGLKTLDGKSPTAFWLTDESGEWRRAEAQILEETVVLHAKEIQKPRYVRYAFAGKPEVNLVNDSGLPAYPFRTDNEVALNR